jgi:hypothetical protein
VYKELRQLNSKEIIQLKMGKGPQQTFLKRRHTNVQWVCEKCSLSIIIREMQIKITMVYHVIPFRMTIIKRSGKNVEQRDPMNTAGRNED